MKSLLLFVCILIIFYCACTRINSVNENEMKELDVHITADPIQGDALLRVSFSVAVDGGVPPYRYEWDFDNSNAIQIDQINSAPEFVYADSGSYIVTLTVRDQLDAIGQDTIGIHVLPGNYEAITPIEMINMHGTVENPIIIRGKMITASAGNGIRLNACSHIIVQDNLIHDVSDPDGINNNNSGNAIVLQSCSDIVIERNCIIDNQKGIYIFSPYNEPPCSNIRVSHNVVRNNAIHHSIAMHWVRDVEVNGNYIFNNGDPAYFLLHRLSGIQIWSFVNLSIHDNISIRSNSDGIALYAAPDQPDKNFINENLLVYNNTVRENSEQGIYLTGIQNGKIYNNYSESNSNPDPSLGSNGLCLSWNVSQFEIYHNVFFNNEICAIMVNHSHDNLIYHNIIREPVAVAAGLYISENDLGDSFYTVRSERNRILNNFFIECPRALWIETGNECDIINNVFCDNGPFYTGTAGIEIDEDAESTIISNNIIVHHDGYGVTNSNLSTTMDYNDFWDNGDKDFRGITPGIGHLTEDPKFVGAFYWNLQLTSDSPCHDAGNPDSRFNDIDGSRNDMGAFGGPLGEWEPLKLMKVIKTQTH